MVIILTEMDPVNLVAVLLILGCVSKFSLSRDVCNCQLAGLPACRGVANECCCVKSKRERECDSKRVCV